MPTWGQQPEILNRSTETFLYKRAAIDYACPLHLEDDPVLKVHTRCHKLIFTTTPALSSAWEFFEGLRSVRTWRHKTGQWTEPLEDGEIPDPLEDPVVYHEGEFNQVQEQQLAKAVAGVIGATLSGDEAQLAALQVANSRVLMKKMILGAEGGPEYFKSEEHKTAVQCLMTLILTNKMYQVGRDDQLIQQARDHYVTLQEKFNQELLDHTR